MNIQQAHTSRLVNYLLGLARSRHVARIKVEDIFLFEVWIAESLTQRNRLSRANPECG